MAATCTSSLTKISEGLNTYMNVARFTFVSHTDGSVSGVGSLSNVSGRIDQVRFIPDSGGTQPSDALDIVLNDAYGLDVLLGLGANLSNSRTVATNVFTPVNTQKGIMHLWNSTLTIGVTNAGSGKGGVLELILR